MTDILMTKPTEKELRDMTQEVLLSLGGRTGDIAYKHYQDTFDSAITELMELRKWKDENEV